MSVCVLLNDADNAEALLERCCVSKAWIKGMLAARPFASDQDVLAKADDIWRGLGKDDWLEAFEGHPKIGDLKSLQQKYANTSKWASGEQSGMSLASEQVIQDLADGNQQYEQRFGYIFIVCATGKSAAEMLAILKGRLDNQPEDELLIAAEEQRKITRIRLEKLNV